MDPTNRDFAEALLVKVGHEYGIQAGKDEVHRALTNAEHGEPFAEWARMHLGSDHLLTADELALYTALDKSGEVDRLAALHDLGDVQAVYEDEIKKAIEELNRSTASITKQTETLLQQQDALSRLVKKGSENQSRRQSLEESRQLKFGSDRKRLAAEVEDMLQSLDFRVSDLEQQTKDSGASLNETVTSIFRDDDKLLSSLQKLGLELEQDDPETGKDVEKIREICMRLIKSTVEIVRTRLDRMYLDAIVAAENSGESKPAAESEVKALEEELESLYSEILPVAQMSIEQEHLEPALKSTDTRSKQGLARSVAAMSYMNECLDYLLERMDCITDTVETLKSHQAATNSVVSTAKSEMAVSVTPVRKTSKHSSPVSPTRKPSPIRMRANTANTRARRRSSGILDEPAVEVLLRNLALALPASEDATTREHVNTLAQVLAERSVKGEDVARNAHESFEATAMSRLDDARRAVQLLRDSVLAETPFAEVRLVDPEIEGSILVLAQEIEKVRTRLDALEEKKGVIKSGKRDELLQRWG